MTLTQSLNEVSLAAMHLRYTFPPGHPFFNRQQFRERNAAFARAEIAARVTGATAAQIEETAAGWEGGAL